MAGKDRRRMGVAWGTGAIASTQEAHCAEPDHPGFWDKSWSSWPCRTGGRAHTWPRAGLLTTSCLHSRRLAGCKPSREQGLRLFFSINGSMDADSFLLSQSISPLLFSLSPPSLLFSSYNPGWLEMLSSPASACRLLGSQVCSTKTTLI